MAAAKPKPPARKTSRKTPAKPRARKAAPPAPDTSVAAAVERDLAEIARRDEALAASALAMTALRLGRELDDRDNSATSKAMTAKALQDALRELRELAPAEEKPDAVSDIEQARQKRRERLAAAKV